MKFIYIRNYSIACLIALFGCLDLSGADIKIFGHDSSYVGVKLTFLKYSDRISNQEIKLADCIVDPSGKFEITFAADEIDFVFAYLGIYKIHLYVQPGEKYEIILPERSEKAPSEMLNPYFSPTVVHLATVNIADDELNELVRMFNDTYQPYYNKHIVSLRNNTDFTELDKDIARMDKPFSKSKNEFFNNYRKYRYGLLRHLAAQKKSKRVSDEYFIGQPVLYNNTAYMELFNLVYNNYFSHFSRTQAGKKLGGTISSNQIDSLRGLLLFDKVLSGGELLDMVILKGLFDEFYDDNYSRGALLAILNQMLEKPSSQKIKAIAQSIYSKVTKLMAGYEPPEIKLFDKDSNLISLQNFKGKYIYLNFCSCFSYTCLNEFEMLNTLYEKHHEYLEIITILVDNDKNVIQSFLARSKYKWLFLHYGNQPDIIKDYDIRAFPIYYLIDKEGKLSISPAPSPNEEFEGRFFKLMRAKGEI